MQKCDASMLEVFGTLIMVVLDMKVVGSVERYSYGNRRREKVFFFFSINE